MDDNCAVCADTLEWVAYGSCGHREVCSTCIVRLRFVLDDRRCCICKIESPTVFVTKAMGDYTRVITDFSMFPPGANEGRVREYWYHENSQAYFDDIDQYKTTKAMCRLSCSVCDNKDEKGEGEAWRRRSRFRSMEQLKGHLFHQHKLFMCSLCLEGRKVFISEQKLYTRAQLNQHIRTGNSEVDGSEAERGGFKGHPLCEFCKNPYYGDNELYVHMTRDHYTCHICQRQHPGQYDYFRNYEDLEIHFRREHYLCEDEVCLAEKFVVFPSEAEFKRHNTIKHGGRMSRSQWNAALQIPTSFRFRQSNAQEQRRGRGRFQFSADSPSNQLAVAIQASLETAYADNRDHDLPSGGSATSGHRDTRRSDAVSNSPESLNVTSGSVTSSRYQTDVTPNGGMPILEESSFPALSDRAPVPESSLVYAQALGSSGGPSRLRQESFPPLPGSSGNAIKETKQLRSTFAEHVVIGRSHNKSVRESVPLRDGQLAGNHGRNHVTAASSSQNWPAFQDTGSSNLASSLQSVSSKRNEEFPLPSSSNVAEVKVARRNRFASPNHLSNPWKLDKTDKLNHSSSAPELVERGSSSNQQAGGNLPTPYVDVKDHSGGQSIQPVEDVRTANKSLVDKIRAGLGMDEEKFAAFRSISGEYREDLLGTVEYLSYVQQFGLSHLTVELARLCPDPKKQKDLINTYNANLQYQNARENRVAVTGSSKESSSSTKKKGKNVQSSNTTTSSRDLLADDFLNTVKRLQVGSHRPHQEEAVELSKDGYRSAKGKLTLGFGEKADSSSTDHMLANGINSNMTTGGPGKQPKKTSKFHRVRLGDGSFSNLDRVNVSPEGTESLSNSNGGSQQVKGAWKKGGAQRLFS